MANGVGQLKEGWLADLLIVEGRPWEDSSALLSTRTAEGKVRSPGIRGIVLDGHFHRRDAPLGAP